MRFDSLLLRQEKISTPKFIWTVLIIRRSKLNQTPPTCDSGSDQTRRETDLLVEYSQRSQHIWQQLLAGHDRPSAIGHATRSKCLWLDSTAANYIQLAFNQIYQRTRPSATGSGQIQPCPVGGRLGRGRFFIPIFIIFCKIYSIWTTSSEMTRINSRARNFSCPDLENLFYIYTYMCQHILDHIILLLVQYSCLFGFARINKLNIILTHNY